MDKHRVPTSAVQATRNPAITKIMSRHQRVKENKRRSRPTFPAEEKPGAGDIIFLVTAFDRTLPTEERSLVDQLGHRRDSEKFFSCNALSLSQIFLQLRGGRDVVARCPLGG